MNIIIDKDRPEDTRTRVRLYTVNDEEKYLVDRENQGPAFALTQTELDREQENLILNTFYQSQANVHAGIQTSYENLRWYAQALGTATTTPARSQTGLTAEMIRKQYTDFSPTAGNPTGRIVTMNTFFSTADYSNWSSTVSNATTPSLTQFSVNATSGVPVAASFPVAIGDLIQIQTPTQYEFRTVANLVGNLITLDSPLSSSAPVVGAVIAQCTEEAGFFGNLSAGPTPGSVALTNGSATVTGSGTTFTNTFAGDLIRFPGSSQPRTWYTVLSVTSNTVLVLSSNFTGTTIGSSTYVCRGTAFNRVNLLRYIKLPTKGFVFEVQWTIGG
jgi:hypothetical protein